MKIAKTILLFLCFAGIASAQCGTNGKVIPNPFTGKPGCTGKTGSAGYSATFTSATGVTVTAATHGQGTKPYGVCYDNATPANLIAQTSGYPTVAANGDMVFAWTGSKTGYCVISALGNQAGPTGAAGTSVTVTSEPAGANCAQGGEKLVSASGTSYVCNGTGGGGIANLVQGSGDPNAGSVACTAPSTTNLSFYQDLSNNNIWVCSATNTWRLIPVTPGSGPYTISGYSGPVATGLASGRPTCSTVGQLYFATDTNALTQCTAVTPETWAQLNASPYLAVVWDATAGTIQSYDSSGNKFTMVKGIANPSDSNCVAYIDQSGVQQRVACGGGGGSPTLATGFNATLLSPSGAAQYVTSGPNSATSGTAVGDRVDVQWTVSAGGWSYSKIQMQCSQSPGTSQTYTGTLRKCVGGGTASCADTALTCSMTGSAKTCSATVAAITAAQGDGLTLEAIASSGATTSTRCSLTVAQ